MRKKITILLALIVCVPALLIQPVFAEQTEAQNSSLGEGRVLHFPPDRFVGKIYLQDADFQKETKTFFCWIPDYEKWDCYCTAKGDVRIPTGKRVKLITNWNRKPDPEDLAKLQPDDLHALVLQGRLRADDLYMDAVGRLTGLKVLDISYPNFMSRGLYKIRKLTELEELSLGEGITDSGMPVVASLKSLKGLHFSNSSITDAGLAKVCENLSLEELSLFGKKLSNEGLAHLAGMGTLKYLRLDGDNFTDAGMAHLKDVSSLRILHAGGLMMITDEGLKHLSEHPHLERISFHHNQNITNEGARYLGRMRSLKMLDVLRSQIDDVGVGYLCKNKTLELLELPGGITEVGLQSISTLEKLKYLRVTAGSTEKGLAYIGKLSELEELWTDGQGITDTSIEHIAKLTKLKLLSLGNCPVTNKGFEKLSALKSLEKLYVRNLKITVSGLKCLNELTDLKWFTLRSVIQDYSVMDLSGLKNLELLFVYTPRESEDFLTDADLACLANLKKLKRIQTRFGAISGEGLKHLAGLPDIEQLCLGGPNLKDEDLRYFSNMKKLNSLTINGDITEKGLEHLKQFKTLGYLSLYPKRVIPHRAVRDLKKSLPGLHTFRMQTK